MAAPPVLLHHPSSLQHDTGAHPERAERITAILDAVEAAGGLGWQRRLSQPAVPDQLHAVHPVRYVHGIREFCEGGGGSIDMDTFVVPESWPAALHAAGGAAQAVDAVMRGGARSAFSVHRPPGHHAEPSRAMGFCLIGNVAVAAQHAIDAHGLQRVLIVDFDVHHGNGTNAIFHSRPDVLFCSLHESPLYPGTGPVSDVGSGEGRGYSLNLPVPARSGDAVYCSLVEHLVGTVARAYEPQLVLISAGYDAHMDDPLASCMVSDEGYGAMAASLRRLADELGAPLAVVLEGGYELGALARSAVETMRVVGAEATPPAVELDVHPVTAAHAGALSGVRPELGVLAG